MNVDVWLTCLYVGTTGGYTERGKRTSDGGRVYTAVGDRYLLCRAVIYAIQNRRRHSVTGLGEAISYHEGGLTIITRRIDTVDICSQAPKSKRTFLHNPIGGRRCIVKGGPFFWPF